MFANFWELPYIMQHLCVAKVVMLKVEKDKLTSVTLHVCNLECWQM